MTEESGDNATAAECISKCQTDTVKEIMCVAVFSCFVKKTVILLIKSFLFCLLVCICKDTVLYKYRFKKGYSFATNEICLIFHIPLIQTKLYWTNNKHFKTLFACTRKESKGKGVLV